MAEECQRTLTGYKRTQQQNLYYGARWYDPRHRDHKITSGLSNFTMLSHLLLSPWFIEVFFRLCVFKKASSGSSCVFAAFSA